MKKGLLLVLVVLVAGVLWWVFMPPNHDKILRERMTEIVRILEKEGEENPVFGTLRINKLKEYLAPTVSLEVALRPGKVSQSREELIAQVVLFRGQYSQIRGLVNIENVLVMEGSREAWITVEGSAWVIRGGTESEYTARYRLYWIRPEKDWLLVSSEILSMSPAANQLVK